jgi:hypothetical protein
VHSSWKEELHVEIAMLPKFLRHQQGFQAAGGLEAEEEDGIVTVLVKLHRDDLVCCAGVGRRGQQDMCSRAKVDCSGKRLTWLSVGKFEDFETHFRIPRGNGYTIVGQLYWMPHAILGVFNTIF